MLLCERLVAHHKLCRSMCQAISTPMQEKFLWLHHVNKWSRNKNRWEDDEPALTKNSSSTTKEENKPALANESESMTEEENISSCLIASFRKSDQNLFIRITKHGVVPRRTTTKSHNDFLVRFLGQDKPYQRIARSYLAQMLLTGTIPDLGTFSILIKCYCNHLTYQHILDVVDTQMKALEIEPDDSFYKILMNGVCARFGPKAGYQLLKKLRSSHGIQMPLSCYDAVVCQCCKRKTMVLALIDVLLNMKQLQIFPDVEIYECLLKGLRIHGGEGFLKAVSIGRHMFAEGIKVGVISPIVVRKPVKT